MMLNIEEMDINWQIAMIAIRMKNFYKKTGKRVRIDGNKPVGFDKKKLECFKCHNTGHFARKCPSKGTNDGKKRDSFYQDQGARNKEHNQNCLLTIDDGVNKKQKILAYTLAIKKLEAQVVTFQKQQLSLNEQLTFQANEIYAKDEKHKKYRRIGMKAIKEKEQLQKTVDSWKNSSKNIWKLVGFRIIPLKKTWRTGGNLIVDASRHIHVNKDHLDDFEECKGGSVTFGGSKGYITGKGRIRVASQDIDYLTDSMNYIHVSLENQTNPHAGTSELTNSAGTLPTPNVNASEEEDAAEELIVVPTVVKHTAAKVGPRFNFLVVHIGMINP
ncbi:ribonuclease H-like domain-containing protein [Tanacetum coccineum]